MRRTSLFALATGILAAQSFSLNQIYICDSGRTKLKVVGCSGAKDTDLCGVQHLNTAGTAEASPRTSEYRKSITEKLQSCQLQPKAVAAAPKAPTTPAAPAPQQQQAARPPAPPPAPSGPKAPVQTV